MDGILFCGIILFFFYNFVLYLLPTLCAISVVVATAKVRIFKQITTRRHFRPLACCCCCYRKGTNFQANHNSTGGAYKAIAVVVATAKVRIFKQITTAPTHRHHSPALLLLPQRYEFSSKSQLDMEEKLDGVGCCCYRKGTNFQANHNSPVVVKITNSVVVATAKVRIFKQITTGFRTLQFAFWLLLLPQRYEFSSKSQHGWL